MPTFGLTINPIDNEIQPVIGANFSVVGMVITAPDAEAVAFPLNTPVYVNSSDKATIAKLGATGSVVGQFDLLNAQLSGLAGSAATVVVRVEEGEDENATIANLAAGIPYLEDAAAILGFTPRLIMVPGYTHQQATSETANVVCAALGGTLEKLFAYAAVSGPHSTYSEYVDWYETLSSQRLIPIETWAKVSDGAGGISVVDSVSAHLGLMIAEDNTSDGVPSKSAANRQINGILGPNRAINFSLTDAASEGQQILSKRGGIIVQGSSSVATALASPGFTAIFTDTAAASLLWKFYNVGRTRDYIHLALISLNQSFLGRRMTLQRVDAIQNGMRSLLKSMVADEHILGYTVEFVKDKNSPENLRLGRLKIGFKAEETPTITHIGIDSERYVEAIDTLIEDIAALAA